MSVTYGAVHVFGVICLLGFGFMWLTAMLDMTGGKQSAEHIVSHAKTAGIYGALASVGLFLVLCHA